MSVLSGMTQPDAGRIRVGGQRRPHRLATQRARARRRHGLPALDARPGAERAREPAAGRRRRPAAGHRCRRGAAGRDRRHARRGGRPRGAHRRPLAGRAAAGRDHQGALARLHGADPRRADLDAHARRRRGAPEGPRPAEGGGRRARLHHPQAARGDLDRRPRHDPQAGAASPARSREHDLRSRTSEQLQAEIVRIMFGEEGAADAPVAELENALPERRQAARITGDVLLELDGVAADGDGISAGIEDVSLRPAAGRDPRRGRRGRQRPARARRGHRRAAPHDRRPRAALRGADRQARRARTAEARAALRDRRPARRGHRRLARRRASTSSSSASASGRSGSGDASSAPRSIARRA